MNNEPTPEVVAQRGEQLIQSLGKSEEVSALMQHSWNLAVCVQRLKEALGEGRDRGPDERRSDSRTD